MNEEIKDTDFLETGYVIDEETGEVLSGPTFALDSLPVVARQIRGIEQRVADVTAFQGSEIQRIKALCQQKVDRLTKQIQFFMSRGEEIVASAGKDKIEYPGLGTFRFGRARESVDDTAFAEMDKDAQAAMRESHPNIFREKVSYAPDKKAIMELLKNGDNIDGFKIAGGGKVFKFEAD